MQKQINKQQWINLFRETGLTEDMMQKWHSLFESKHLQAHQGFLEWLGISQAEIETIRKKSL